MKETITNILNENNFKIEVAKRYIYIRYVCDNGVVITGRIAKPSFDVEHVVGCLDFGKKTTTKYKEYSFKDYTKQVEKTIKQLNDIN